MYSIGISAYYHDSSVSLFKNGELIFACEEEKFSGIKHDGRFPFLTLNHIIKKYKLTKDNVDVVCFYEDHKIKGKRVLEYSKKLFFTKPLFSIKNYFRFLKNRNELLKLLPEISSKIFYSKHHHSHLYYSAFSSPFKESAVVSIDGVGEYDTTTISHYTGGTLNVETLSQYPHSIGLFYSAMTSFLGFKPNEGEYKLMGLAPYGKKSHFVDKVDELIKFERGEIRCDLNYFDWYKSTTSMYNYNLSKHIGILPRSPEEEITKDHMDLAYAVQATYEKVFFQILNYVQEKYNSKNLCLGGGCAYNGSANGKIYYRTLFNKVWIPPSPSDAGSSVGSVINYRVQNNLPVKIRNNPFLGPSFVFNNNKRVDLEGRNFFHANNDMIYRIVSKEIARGKVIGWFRDEIEFGARALGNRSILADPTNPLMKDRINKLVKRREGFRPFAPMVAKERQNEFFEINDDIPYMNQVVKVKDDYINILKSVTHVDGTARVQTVTPNSHIHGLLREFERLTGYPILLNTSFNIKDKTMVLTPKQALQTFDEVDIDVLVIQNFIIFKNKRK